MDLIYRKKCKFVTTMKITGIAIKGYRLTLIKDLFGKDFKENKA